MLKGSFVALFVILIAGNSYPQETHNLFASFTSGYIDPFDVNSPAESVDEIDLFLSTASDEDPEKLSDYKSSLEKFIERQSAKKRRTRDDKFFIKNLFYKVHNKYLKHYKNYVAFDEIFQNGNYDCVTGTALYALILDKLGYNLHIYESNFHVFLLVDLPGEDVLIESTDFYTGYVDDRDQISSRIAHYQLSDENSGGDYYSYQSSYNRFINSRQLAGLLYFNLAVEQYNDQNFTAALSYLKKAEVLYASQRMQEFKGLINKMVFASNSVSLKK